jgi:hypothetical protein
MAQTADGADADFIDETSPKYTIGFFDVVHEAPEPHLIDV